MRSFFINRQYPAAIVDRAVSKALSIDRITALTPKTRAQPLYSMLKLQQALHRWNWSWSHQATNYSKKLTSYKYVKFLHLLLDVIKEVSKISLMFQKDDNTIPAV